MSEQSFGAPADTGTMRFTILVPGVWIRGIDRDGDFTDRLIGPSFGLTVNSTKQQVIDAWANHNWTLIAQVDVSGAWVFVVDRPGG